MVTRIYQGDALSVLRTLESESVQCVITSPPYLGLRSYGTEPQVWGGDPDHAHEWGMVPSPGSRTSDTSPGPLQHPGNKGRERLTSSLCACGAWRGELGLEPTPALFVAHLVAIFEEVKRTLRPDGTCWVNIGDSYWTRSAMRKGGNREQIKAMAGEVEMDSWAEHAAQGRTRYSSGHPTLKDKDLTLIPERFAIAMQDAGWWVRSRIAWCKTSAMPESVRDRPTSAWEHLWLFTKARTYYYDAEAVRQPAKYGRREWKGDGYGYVREADPNDKRINQKGTIGGAGDDPSAGANLRNYWLLGPEPSSLEHYASFVTEIPRRCILAGTSQRGCCPACRAPWVRVVEEIGKPAGRERNRGGRDDGFTLPVQWKNGENPTTRTTTGWKPGCRCDAGEPVPCVVLDPFLGSGMTALVASRLGRDAVGIELSPAYAEMARQRIYGDAPLFSQVLVE